MLTNDPDILRFAVDLLLAAGAVAALIYIFVYRLMISSRSPNLGRVLIFGGLILMILAYAADGFSWLLTPGLSLDDHLRAHGGGIASWVHWLITRSSFAMIVSGVLLTVRHRELIESGIRTSEKQVKAAEESVVMTELRYRSLVDNTSDSVYCFRFDPPMPVGMSIDKQIERSNDAFLVDCNKRFASNFGCERPAEIFGLKMRDMDSTKDTEAHGKLITEFARNNYRLNGYELIYKTPAGVDRALRVSMTGFIRHGCLHRFWAAERDILSFQRARSALHNSQQFTRLLADVSSRLLTASFDDVDEQIIECMRRVCEFVDGERGTIIWIAEDNAKATIEYFWNEKNQPPLQDFSNVTYPGISKMILQGQPVSIDDVSIPTERLEADCSNLQTLGVKSFAAVPIKSADRVTGALTISNWSIKRVWTDTDLLMLKVFGDLFANVVLRIKSFRALNEALGGLQKATQRLEAENVYLRQEMKSTHRFDDIVGHSDELLRSLQKVEQVADTDMPVLILGETGTGKELVAKAVHRLSERSEQPMIKVNCAALPEPLIESELFGHEKGAFTGATAPRKGRFDLADGGTIFLDEIGDLPAEVQAKLLRVLQEGEFERLGGSHTMKVDVRIIAATNRDLHRDVAEGRFRSDLLYRINTFPIELPPLRDRQGDVRILSEHFVSKHGPKLGADVAAISSSMMRQLEEYRWPGNVRELESVIQRSLIAATGPVLELVEPLIHEKGQKAQSEHRIIGSTIADLRIVEREHIVRILEEAEWKISGQQGAAARLGVPPSTLRSKMKRLHISRPH